MNIIHLILSFLLSLPLNIHCALVGYDLYELTQDHRPWRKIGFLVSALSKSTLLFLFVSRYFGSELSDTEHIILCSFFLPICAYVWCEILIQGDGVFASYRTWIDQFPEDLFKALGGCTVCFSGQLALWTFPISCYYLDINYQLLNHFICVVMTIFLTDKMK